MFAFLVLITACGREGSLLGAAPNRFCQLAASLEREAGTALIGVGPKATTDQVLVALNAFGETHLSEYEQLERLAPREIKPLLRAQRDYRRQLPTVPKGPQRDALLPKAVANGTRIKLFEVVFCRRQLTRAYGRNS
jgi:hypothetical protein